MKRPSLCPSYRQVHCHLFHDEYCIKSCRVGAFKSVNFPGYDPTKIGLGYSVKVSAELTRRLL